MIHSFLLSAFLLLFSQTTFAQNQTAPEYNTYEYEFTLRDKNNSNEVIQFKLGAKTLNANLNAFSDEAIFYVKKAGEWKEFRHLREIKFKEVYYQSETETNKPKNRKNLGIFKTNYQLYKDHLPHVFEKPDGGHGVTFSFKVHDDFEYFVEGMKDIRSLAPSTSPMLEPTASQLPFNYSAPKNLTRNENASLPAKIEWFQDHYQIESEGKAFTLFMGSRGLEMKDEANHRLLIAPEAKSIPFRNDISIEDGILKVNNIIRNEIDLRNFEGEIIFKGDTKPLIAVENSQDLEANPGKTSHLNVVKEINKNYPDLVKEFRKLENVNPELEALEGKEGQEILAALSTGKSVKFLGPAGTGKSSDILQLAKEIAIGKYKNVPRTLELRQLSINKLTAGTVWRGSLEKRAELILSYSFSFNPIWDIDEAQGLRSETTLDFLQQIKAPLERGELRLIASSTEGEWDHAFASDEPFDQRFMLVTKKEPQGEKLLKIIRNAFRKKAYPLPDPLIIHKAVELSNRFEITGKQPRAAINLLLYAAGEGNFTQGLNRTPISLKQLEDSAIQKYKIYPLFFNKTSLTRVLEKTEHDLAQQMSGQSLGINELLQAYYQKLADVGSHFDGDVLLFYGESGTGKTLLSRLVAEKLGLTFKLIKMNHYPTKYDVEAFHYEVYLALVQNPNTVFLLDEIEKSAVEVQNAALQMVTGNFTLNFTINKKYFYKEINCKNALFTGATNAAKELLNSTRTPVGFPRANEETQKAIPDEELAKAKMIEQGMSSALLSRSRLVPMFLPLRSEFQDRLLLDLNDLLKYESKQHGFQIKMTNKKAWVLYAMKNFQAMKTDYRMVAKLLKRQVIPLLAQAVVEQASKKSTAVTVKWSPELVAANFKALKQCNFIYHQQ